MQTQSTPQAINLKQWVNLQTKSNRRYTTTGSAQPYEQYTTAKTSPTHINISIISDRIPLYKEYHQQFVNAMQLGDTTEAIRIRDEVTKHLQNKIIQFIPDTPTQLFHILGIWDGGFEQSFRITFQHLTDDILHAMVKVAKHFEQDSVHFIRPIQPSELTRPVGIADQKGNVFTSVWELFLKAPINLSEFQKMISHSGLAGAQLSEDSKIITIYNSYNGEQSKNEAAAKAATEEWEAKATTFTDILQQKGIEKANIGFGEFRSYGRSLLSATRTYEELDSDIFSERKEDKRIEKTLPKLKNLAA